MSGGESSPIVAVGGITLPAMRLSGMLTLGDIRDAVQELRDSSLEELRRLLAGYSRAYKAGDTTDTDILAAKVGTTTRMSMVAHLLRAGAKWGVVTIYREPDRRCGEHEVNDLMGWTPPPITVVRQMSPSQMDELSHQIFQ